MQKATKSFLLGRDPFLSGWVTLPGRGCHASVSATSSCQRAGIALMSFPERDTNRSQCDLYIAASPQAARGMIPLMWAFPLGFLLVLGADLWERECAEVTTERELGCQGG